MSKKTTISRQALTKCAKDASTHAVTTARASKVGYTVQEGRSIVKHKSDGTSTVVGTLAKAYSRSTERSYRIG